LIESTKVLKKPETKPPGVRGTESRIWLTYRWSEIAQQLSEKDEVRKNLREHDAYLTEPLTPTQFVEEVEKRIRNQYTRQSKRGFSPSFKFLPLDF